MRLISSEAAKSYFRFGRQFSRNCGINGNLLSAPCNRNLVENLSFSLFRKAASSLTAHDPNRRLSRVGDSNTKNMLGVAAPNSSNVNQN